MKTSSQAYKNLQTQLESTPISFHKTNFFTSVVHKIKNQVAGLSGLSDLITSDSAEVMEKIIEVKLQNFLDKKDALNAILELEKSTKEKLLEIVEFSLEINKIAEDILALSHDLIGEGNIKTPL